MFLNSILSDVNEIAFMCSNVFRVVENVECFCNFFLWMGCRICSIHYINVCGCKRICFCLGIGKQGRKCLKYYQPLRVCYWQSSGTTCLGLNIACLDGNGGLGVGRRQFSLAAKQGRNSPSVDVRARFLGTIPMSWWYPRFAVPWGDYNSALCAQPQAFILSLTLLFW